MNASVGSGEIVPEDFVLARSPLLPMAEWLQWTLQAANPALSDADRTASLLHRLTPSFLDGLFLASPDLFDHLRQPPGSGGRIAVNRKTKAAMAALATFYCRASARCTPLGAFAGLSLGRIATNTGLRFPPAASWQKKFTLDLRWVMACCRWLERQPEVMEQLRYSPNPTLWRAGHKYRFLEEFRKTAYKNHRWFRISTVDASGYLNDVIRQAARGATPGDLTESLARCFDCTPIEARPFIDELIKEQILISELQPPLTGIDPGRWLVKRLSLLGMERNARELDQLLDELNTPPFRNLGTTADSYRRLESRLAGIAPVAGFTGKSAFFANLWKPAEQCALGANVISDIQQTLAMLHRITVRDQDRLRPFRRAFRDRYETREVPLLEALDEEIGLPTTEPLDRPPAELSGIIPRNVILQNKDSSRIDWTDRDQQMLEWVLETIQKGETELRLDRRNLARLEAENPGSFLPSFFVYAALGAPSAAHIDRGDYRFSLWGYMAAGALGRFSQDEPALEDRLRTIARREADFHAERGAVVAEICHYPAGQELNNILTRPRFLDYEIALFCGSEPAGEHVIRPEELMVSVEGGTVFLRCPRLGREVIPRMHTAHRFDNPLNLRVYRFLNDIARQYIHGGPSWSWGSLERLPFLPRVTWGRAILAPARWRVRREDLYPNTENEEERLQAIEAFRRKAGLPRFATLAQNDLRLPIDFNNLLSVRGLVRQAQPWPQVEFEEIFPAPGDLWAQGPEGTYSAEWIVPFRSAAMARVHPPLPAPPQHRERRVFPPGSEWIYAKIYLPAAFQDDILRNQIFELVRDLENSGLIDQWFFIRYQDPHMHLRLRFHAAPGSAEGELFRLVQSRLSALVEGETSWRLQFDTYEREMERYGGDDIVQVEKIFHCDSEGVLNLLREQPEIKPGRRWLLAVAGIDSLLTDLGFDDQRKALMTAERRDAFRKEFRSSAKELRRAGELFRTVRGDMLTMIRQAREGKFRSLNRRSETLRALFTGRACSDQLASDLCHLHCNRLLRSSQRQQELAIYDLMSRACDAILHGALQHAE